MKFALEHQNPPVAGIVKGSSNTGFYPADQFSLLNISNPDVLLWALKPHEDGIENGIVARVWNQAGKDSNTRVSGLYEIKSAQRLTHIETPVEEIPVTDGTLNINIGANRIETYKLMFEKK
jgi:alpha-mannosidase